MRNQFTERAKLTSLERRNKRLMKAAIVLAFISTYFFFIKLLFL